MGSFLWGFIHTISIIDHKDTSNKTQKTIERLHLIQDLLPCPICKGTYIEYLEKLYLVDKRRPVMKKSYRVLLPIIDLVFKGLHHKAKFSLDSYSPVCLEYALQKGFSIVNDITALRNDEVAKVAAKYDATVVF